MRGTKTGSFTPPSTQRRHLRGYLTGVLGSFSRKRPPSTEPGNSKIHLRRGLVPVSNRVMAFRGGFLPDVYLTHRWVSFARRFTGRGRYGGTNNM